MKEWNEAALARLAPRYAFEFASFDPQRPAGMLRLPGFARSASLTPWLGATGDTASPGF